MIKLSLIALIFLAINLDLLGQDHLSVSYIDGNSVPSHLNVCGDADLMQIRISPNGQSIFTRENIVLYIQFFVGIELDSIDVENSSSGIVLIDNSDPNRPIFELPNIESNIDNHVDLSLYISANCEYLDSIESNNEALVFDNYRIVYDLDSQIGIEEQEQTSEYRDALTFPFYTVQLDNENEGIRLGTCEERSILVNNSSLDGSSEELKYTITQDEGLNISEIEANGILLDYNSVVEGNDSIIEISLGANIFTENINGNGDGIFDPNEQLIIVERYCVTSCFSGSFSSHTISWGCEETTCRAVTDYDFVEYGQGAAEAAINLVNQNLSKDIGYCTEGKAYVKFGNDGFEIDEDFGAMVDVEIEIGLGPTLSNSDNGYEISSIFLENISLPVDNGIITLNNNVLFSEDIDGNGGLEDIDNDGYYDDIPVGGEVVFEVYYLYNCDYSEDNNSPESLCKNDRLSALNSHLSWLDACEIRKSALGLGLKSFINNNTLLETNSTTDAFAEEEIFFINIDYRRSLNDFTSQCDSERIFRIKSSLPNNINLIESQIKLNRNGLVDLPLISSSQIDGGVEFIFDTEALTNLNGEYSLQLAFEAECPAELGSTFFDVSWDLECSECDCVHNWYCDTVNGAIIHNNSPPCEPEFTLDCHNGVITRKFIADRVTFGYTDTNFDTLVSPEDANTKVALPCDLVDLHVEGEVGESPISETLALKIYYDAYNISQAENYLLNFVEGELNIQTDDGIVSCGLDTEDITYSVEGLTHFMYIEFDNCNADIFQNLLPHTLIDFKGTFEIGPGNTLPVQFTTLPNFRSSFIVINDDIADIGCNSFGTNLTLGSNETFFTFPSTQDFPSGCSRTALQYRLIKVNNGFSNYFPNEFRQAIIVDSIVLDYDPEILEAFELISVKVSLPNHPIHGNDLFDIELFQEQDQGHYSARFDTLQELPALNNLINYAFLFQVEIQPTCLSAHIGGNNQNTFSLNPTIYYRDNAYALDYNPNATCSTQKIDSHTGNIFYSNPPQLNLTNLSSENFTLQEDTAAWLVQICNISQASNANNPWIGIIENDNIIDLISIEDVTYPNNIQNLELIHFGNEGEKYYAYFDNLLKSDFSNNIEDYCKTFRIQAGAQQCQDVGFKVITGYNCIEHPLDWNPEIESDCSSLQKDLSLSILSPFLDASIENQNIESTSLCGENEVTIVLKNDDLGTAYNLRTQIILPIFGAEFIENSFQIAYPSNTPFQNISTSPEFIEQNQNGIVFQFNDFQALSETLHNQGLIGFDPLNPSLKDNEIKLRFKYTTNCDFISGTNIKYNFVANRSCGSLSNYEAGETLPIIIEGAPTPIQPLYNVSIDSNTILHENALSTLTVNAKINQGLDIINPNFLSVILPDSISYQEGSSIQINPSPQLLSDPDIEILNGHYQLIWPIPFNLEENQTFTVNFDVQSPFFSCELNELEFTIITIENHTIECLSNSSPCTLQSITSNSPFTQIVSITKDDIFTLDYFGFNCLENQETQLQLLGHFNGIDNNTTNLIAYLYHDENENNIIDPQDILIDSILINDENSNNQILPIDWNIQFNNNALCNLLLYIDFEGLAAPCPTSTIKLQSPISNFAGNNQNQCHQNNEIINISIGNVNCNTNPNATYQWNIIQGSEVATLNQSDVLQPNLTIITDQAQDIVLTLTAEGYFCNPIVDTITISVSESILIEDNLNINTQANIPVTLNLEITSGTPPFDYHWTPAQGLSDTTTQNTIAIVAQNTSYTLTITDANECSAQALFNINITDNFSSSVSQDTSCFSAIGPTLNAFGGDTYLWDADPENMGGILNVNNQSTVIFSEGSPDQNYTYFVNITDSSNPTINEILEVQFYIAPKPQIELPSQVTSCIGQSITLSPQIQHQTLQKLIYNWIPETTTNSNGSISVSPNETTEYQLVTSNQFQCSDTTTTQVFIQDPCTYTDTIVTNQTQNWCIPQSILSELGQNITINNNCPLSQNNVSYVINYENYCIEYTGIQPGIDTICLELCDESLNCYNLNFIITVMPGISITDTIYLYGGTHQYCFGQLPNFNETISSIDNICLDESSTAVSFNLTSTNPYCIEYNPLNPGTNQACYLIIGENGGSYLVNYQVTVIQTMPIWFVDTIYLAQTDTFCLDSSELIHPVETYGESCLEVSTGNVEFFYNPVSHCIEYTGIQLGIDTACVYICDDFGICDSTYFSIHVVPFFDPPIAVDDIDTTQRGVPTVVNIKSNDLIFGGIIDSEIILQPLYGTAILNPDCSITYLPDPHYCERNDQFTYQICNENGCDQATVEIFIECLNVRVFNVLSPNGDGINDEFYISNIEDKNANIEIYNRWGNLVFKSANYQNNWPGTFNSKTDLPDGTYFYILDWSDPVSSASQSLRGYIDLHR